MGIQRSEKQDEFFKAYRSNKFNVFALAGGTGSGKTFGILMMIHTVAKLCPGVRIAIFRKSEKNLKTNTIPSYKKLLLLLNESIPIVDLTAKYANGSEVLFLWADITKDPDCDNAKGGEFTMAYLNEANQIDQQYYNILKTRVGRWNIFNLAGQQMEIAPAIILDFNPTNNWVKTEFYDKYENNTLDSNVYFQLSLPKDNPENSEDFFRLLETLPEAEYERYVKGNWNYGDDPNQLIKYEWIRDNLSVESDFGDEMGIDVAREGNDKSVISINFKGQQSRLEILNTQDVISVGDLAITKMMERGISADKVRCDSIGVGGGTVDYMRLRGYDITSYNSGSRPDIAYKELELNDKKQQVESFLQYYNRRAQDYWRLRERLINNEIKILNDPDLIKELTNIKYLTKDKYIQIESKREIKKRLGYSPDKADATCIGFSEIDHNAFSFAFG